MTADEAIHGEVELAEAQTADSSIGFERTLHGFFLLDSALRPHAESGLWVSLGMGFEGRGRLVGFVVCSHWASMDKVHI